MSGIIIAVVSEGGESTDGSRGSLTNDLEH